MDFNAQPRVCVRARVLVDAEQDWFQVTVEAHGVDPRHVLAIHVGHAHRLDELGPQMARLCTRLLDTVRETTGTRSPSSPAPTSTQH